MSHELDVIRNGVNAGRKAMFAVGGSVWHDPSNSVAVDGVASVEAGLEIGGLNFDVDLHPMTTEIAGKVIGVPDSRAVVRMDSTEVLGVVGPSYHVLQNRDAFAPLQPLLDAGLATLETGGSLRGGRDVWMSVKFNLDGNAKIASTFGGEVLPYALISNNHVGARKVTLQETPIRVVCANTLGFALRNLSRGIQVRHTTNVKARTVEAASTLFGEIVERYETIADQYAAMKATALSESLFERLVLDVVAPKPDASKVKERKDNIAKAAYEKALAAAEIKRNRLAWLWDNGDGHTGDHSAWEAYNAATQSLDHDADLWGSKNRAESLFDGTLAKGKQAVVESIVEFVMAN